MQFHTLQIAYVLTMAKAFTLEDVKRICETGSVENIYAEVEPEDMYDLDVLSGNRLLPLNEQLCEKHQYYTDCGMFESFSREKAEYSVRNMKKAFLEAIKNTEYQKYFTEEDEWMAKGSSADGSLFPTVYGLDETLFKKEILGDFLRETDIKQLEEFISKCKPTSGKVSCYVYVPDTDIMISPKQLSISSEGMFQATQYPGYNRIFVKERNLGDWDVCLESENPERNALKILSPVKAKEIFYHALCKMRSSLEKDNKTMIIVPHGLAYQGALVESTGSSFSAHLYDFAFGIKCKFWPNCAKEWVTRPRLWPSKQEILAIANEGVHVMIKSPTPTNDLLLWRISFARAEYSIARLPLVYWYTVVPQRLMKNFIQDLNINKPKILTSYHIKTMFLYALERLPEEYWINGENRLKTVLGIIDELIFCLATHECKHYFMPQVNLLKSTSNPVSPDFFPTVARQLLTARAKIASDPVAFFYENKLTGQ